MATVIPALGTTLAVDKAGDGLEYTPITQIVSVEGASNEVGSIETTHLGSTRKTYRPGLPDGGEVSFEVEYDPADTEHKFLRGLADEPEILSWQISYPTLPKATLDTFDGFLTAFTPGAGGAEENLTASVTIKVTGPVVTTTAA